MKDSCGGCGAVINARSAKGRKKSPLPLYKFLVRLILAETWYLTARDLFVLRSVRGLLEPPRNLIRCLKKRMIHVKRGGVFSYRLHFAAIIRIS